MTGSREPPVLETGVTQWFKWRDRKYWYRYSVEPSEKDPCSPDYSFRRRSAGLAVAARKVW